MVNYDRLDGHTRRKLAVSRAQFLDIKKATPDLSDLSEAPFSLESVDSLQESFARQMPDRGIREGWFPVASIHAVARSRSP